MRGVLIRLCTDLLREQSTADCEGGGVGEGEDLGVESGGSVEEEVGGGVGGGVESVEDEIDG